MDFSVIILILGPIGLLVVWLTTFLGDKEREVEKLHLLDEHNKIQQRMLDEIRSSSLGEIKIKEKVFKRCNNECIICNKPANLSLNEYGVYNEKDRLLWSQEHSITKDWRQPGIKKLTESNFELELTYLDPTKTFKDPDNLVVLCKYHSLEDFFNPFPKEHFCGYKYKFREKIKAKIDAQNREISRRQAAIYESIEEKKRYLKQKEFLKKEQEKKEQEKKERLKTLRKDRYISKDVQIEVWEIYKGQCVECGAKEKLEYDHIIPVSKGGSNSVKNIQLLCQSCNRKKSDKIGG